MSVVVEVGPFEEFFREQYASLVALGVWLTGDRASGEDLAQEALGITHGRWSEVAGYDRPGAFARRTLINLASNERRRRRRERGALRRLVAVGEPMAADLASTSAATFGPLWAAVAALPLQQRAAVGLRYLDDLPAAGIAAALGCSEATVRVHLHRAHRRLAERLDCSYDDISTPDAEDRST